MCNFTHPCTGHDLAIRWECLLDRDVMYISVVHLLNASLIINCVLSVVMSSNDCVM